MKFPNNPPHLLYYTQTLSYTINRENMFTYFTKWVNFRYNRFEVEA